MKKLTWKQWKDMVKWKIFNIFHYAYKYKYTYIKNINIKFHK